MAYPRVFRRRFKCAYHDRRFYLTFRFSNLSRRWKVEAAEKIESTAVTEYDEDGASDIPAGRDVPLSAIDQRSFFCPWCEIGCIKDSPLVGGKNYWAAIVHCDRCDELVCLGNSDDEKFTCGKSCGHSGMPVITITTSRSSRSAPKKGAFIGRYPKAQGLR